MTVASPLGRRCPVGADEGASEAWWSLDARAARRLPPSPQLPLPVERGLTVPSPLGRRCPVGADEGASEAWRSLDARAAAPLTAFTPTPSPGEEGLEQASPTGGKLGHRRNRQRDRPGIRIRMLIRIGIRRTDHAVTNPQSRFPNPSSSGLLRRRRLIDDLLQILLQIGKQRQHLLLDGAHQVLGQCRGLVQQALASRALVELGHGNHILA